jgi:FlaA1/EpsC-like NDP-sugar epimerase
LRTYKNIWIYATIIDYAKLAISCFAASIIVFIVDVFLSYGLNILLFNQKEVFLSVFISAIGILSFRIFVRLVAMIALDNEKRKEKKNVNVVIFGAGLAAKRLINSIKTTNEVFYNVVGLIDDDPVKHNAVLSGNRVLGNRNDIVNICAKNDVDEIIIAVPSATKQQLRDILEICSKTDCKVRILPEISDSFMSTDNYLKRTRDVQIEDLLSRDPVILDTKGISGIIEGKCVLVSGGGGSIGSELCRQIVSFNPKTLIVVDIYENNAYDLQTEMKMKHPFLNLIVLIATVRDKERLDYIFKKYRPDVVFHAAAHKHVPLMEDSPGEAIKNNVFGTYNISKVASDNNVKKFIMISTDKAVNPTNVMGATKRICEMIIQSFNTVSNTEFVAVRFGNVLGSNGSVIPLFKRQIEQGGPVTVTHKEVTRFFMTIPEAAQLVLQASAYAKGGEIFVLDMGQPVKIYDLAENLVRLSGYRPGVDIEIKVTGLRPGEKLYEELLMNEEGLGKTSHSKIFVGQPTFLNYKELMQKLDVLNSALATLDNTKIIDAIKETVPTYVSTPND